MPFWRRDEEPLHERLAREGGLPLGEIPPHDTRPRWGNAGIHGIPRPREWDAIVRAEGIELDADEVRFVALGDGTLVVDGDEEGDLAQLAEAVEEELKPPVPRPGRPDGGRRLDGRRGGDRAGRARPGARRRGARAHRARRRAPAARRRRPRLRGQPRARAARRGARRRLRSACDQGRRRPLGRPRPAALGGPEALRVGPIRTDTLYRMPQLGNLEKALRFGEGRRLKRLRNQAEYVAYARARVRGALGCGAHRQDRRVQAADRERRAGRRADLRGVRDRARGLQAHDGRCACSTSR